MAERNAGIHELGYPQAKSKSEANDGWWISLAIRWTLLLVLGHAYVLLFTGNWGLWWNGLFAPGTASAHLLQSPLRFVQPYWHIVRTVLNWFATLVLRPGSQKGPFWGLLIDFLGYIPLAFLWTTFDRSRKRNAVLKEILYFLVRIWLATGMFLYGGDKVIDHQGVPQPASLDWSRPLGEIPTGEVMWIWLGYSPVFQFFAGLNETTGAVLLLFRRTTLLGALLVLPVMFYVATMDATFHVGPAAEALLYGMGALYLLARERQRLGRVFLHAKPTTPSAPRNVWTSPRLVLAGRTLWIVAAAYALLTYPLSELRETIDFGTGQSPLSGSYRVEHFLSDGRVLPEDAADPTRWRQVSIARFGDFVRIRRMDDVEMLWSLDPGDPYRFLVPTGHGYRFGAYAKLLTKTTAPEGQLRFKAIPNYGGPTAGGGQDDYFGALSRAKPENDEFYTLHYARNADGLSLQGRVDGEDLAVDLRKVENNRFPFFQTRELP
jgi:hypothetical protein